MPGERTLFEAIHKLLPGHWLLVGPEGIKCERYWDLEFRPDFQRSAADTAEELRELLLDAVRIHMRCDVPVGVFLSGGLDSRTMVGLLAEAGVQNAKTFSVAYRDGAEYDETAHAILVADHFKTDHHVLYVDRKQFVDFIPHLFGSWTSLSLKQPLSHCISSPSCCIVMLPLLCPERGRMSFTRDTTSTSTWVGWKSIVELPHVMRALLLEPMLSTVDNEKLRKYLRLAQKPLEERYLGVSLNGSEYHSVYTREFSEVLRENAQIHTPSLLLFQDVGTRSFDANALQRL